MRTAPRPVNPSRTIYAGSGFATIRAPVLEIVPPPTSVCVNKISMLLTVVVDVGVKLNFEPEETAIAPVDSAPLLIEKFAVHAPVTA